MARLIAAAVVLALVAPAWADEKGSKDGPVLRHPRAVKR
jgi:hypothetical protein